MAATRHKADRAVRTRLRPNGHLIDAVIGGKGLECPHISLIG